MTRASRPAPSRAWIFVRDVHMKMATWMGATPHDPARLLKWFVWMALDDAGEDLVHAWIDEWRETRKV